MDGHDKVRLQQPNCFEIVWNQRNHVEHFKARCLEALGVFEGGEHLFKE